MFSPKFSLANAQKQTYLQDFPHTSGMIAFFLFPQSSQALLLTAATFQNAQIADCWWLRLQVQSVDEEYTNVEQTVPSSLGAPNCHWGWLYKRSNCHQTFPQMETDTWSIQRSLHYHICLFGKYIWIHYFTLSFLFLYVFWRAEVKQSAAQTYFERLQMIQLLDPAVHYAWKKNLCINQ